MKNFALIGAAGFIAPRHMMAIRDTGNRLIAVTDPHDSVGILDKYFDNVSYFKEFERFERHIEKLKFQGSEDRIDYVSVCSPNYLHDSHIRFGLRAGADVICEKPLVINPWNLDPLMDLEEKVGRKVFTVLQLRLHPAVKELRNHYLNSNKVQKIKLHYITSRGPWYDYSWKGDEQKSGGLLINIGVHFFDMLCWIFGSPTKAIVTEKTNHTWVGKIFLERAEVEWMLSIDKKLLPATAKEKGLTTYRKLEIEDQEFNFSEGFTDLHTVVYKDILNGGGFRISEAKMGLEAVSLIKKSV